MTGKEKKGILILVGVVLIALLVVVLVTKGSGDKTKETQGNILKPTENNTEKYATNIEDGTKINNSTEFNKTKRYNNIEFTNIQFTYEEGRSVLLADMKNTGSIKHNAEIVKITILDENNQAIDVLSPVIKDIEPGATEQLNVIISGKDAVNAKDFKIEAK